MKSIPPRRPSQRPDVVAEALAVLTIIASALFWMAPTLLSSGWPLGHEALATFERVEIFRREFQQGHWYPLWLPELQNGWGSADVIFHDRLFPMLAALLTSALGLSIVTAVKTATCLFLIVGGMGMRQLLRVTGASEPWAVGGALLFVLFPFTLTDWLIQGALSEFTALMLLPWLYAELGLFLQNDRRWIELALLTVLLFHANALIGGLFLLSAIGFFTYTIVAVRLTWMGWQYDIWRLLSAVVILVVGIVPQVLITARMHRYFDLVATPKSFQPPIEAGAVLAAAVLVHLLPGPEPRWRSVFQVPLYPFVLAWSAVCLVLQVTAFHSLVHVSDLNAFLSVGLVVVLISGARSASQGGWFQSVAAIGVTGAAIALTASLLLSGRYRPDTISTSDIAADLANLDAARSTYALHGRTPSRPLPERPLLAADGCARPVHIDRGFRDGALKLSADEPEPCQISIRQLHTPLLMVASTGATVESRPPSLDIVVTLDQGESSIEVRPRSLYEMVLWALGR